MKHKRMTTSSGRFIDIYDDVFPTHLRSHHIEYANNSNYNLGSASTITNIWQRDKTFFQSIWSKEEFESFQFTNDELLLKLQDYEATRCWCLASSPLSTYYFHTDSTYKPGVTLLYYLNTRWNRDWGGETLFANDEGECEIAVEYKPGRVVIFDSMIEHKPSPISMEADEFRFIFVLQMQLKLKTDCAS